MVGAVAVAAAPRGFFLLPRLILAQARTAQRHQTPERVARAALGVAVAAVVVAEQIPEPRARVAREAARLDMARAALGVAVADRAQQGVRVARAWLVVRVI
jgi:hypothetical protein